MRPAALACLLCALSVCAGEADAAEPGHLSFEAGAEGFSWREYDQGRRLLAETGPRLRLSAAYGNVLTATSGLLFDLSITGQAGEVDYDGQDNSGRFVASNTRYRGYGARLETGYRHQLSSGGAVDVFGGLDLAGWRRDIRSGVNSLGFAVAGFIEDYTVLSGRLGLGLLHSAGRAPARLAVGAILPIDVEEDLSVRGRGITLEPARRASAFASWQLSLSPTVDGTPFGTYLHFYWESLRFGASPARAVDDLSVWQPRSHMDEIGLALGMRY